MTDIIINATSVGLNESEIIDLDYKKISKNKFFYDIIYNPSETNFLKKSKEFGAQTENGKMMFIHQAQKAFFIWHKILPKIEAVWFAARELKFSITCADGFCVGISKEIPTTSCF